MNAGMAMLNGAVYISALVRELRSSAMPLVKLGAAAVTQLSTVSQQSAINRYMVMKSTQRPVDYVIP